MEAATILQDNLVVSWERFETRVSDLENWLVALTFFFFNVWGFGQQLLFMPSFGEFKNVRDLPALADEESQEVNPVTLDFL